MQTALKYIQSELKGLYSEDEIRNMAYLFFEHLTSRSRSELMINKYTAFSEEQHQKTQKFVAELQNFVPLQYILGETEFYGLLFRVNESVLIPRPETEELIEWISMENDRKKELRMLDIGTGSGCIAVTLKHLFAKAHVDAYDVSEEALTIAAANAAANGLDVNFSKIDILQVNDTTQRWDIIVSNPPYICEKEKADMSPNVLDHEPHLALFVPDNDPLLFYRRIADFARHHLTENGKLYFEINRAYGQQTVAALNDSGFTHIELRKDMSGNERMIRANKLS